MAVNEFTKNQGPTIEAFQMTEVRHTDASEHPVWLQVACSTQRCGAGSVYKTNPRSNDDSLSVHTVDGPVVLAYDDWIVQDESGGLFVMSDADFTAGYTAV